MPRSSRGMTPSVWRARALKCLNRPTVALCRASTPFYKHAKQRVDGAISMASELKFDDPRLATLDGFRVEIDEPRERADVILDRPPLNVVSMPQRDQLRLVFESLDDNSRIRIIVLRAIGEHFSSGGNIKGFLDARPETVSKLAWNIAAPARCAKPVIAANRGFCFGVGFELSLACDFRIVSETGFYALPEQRLGQIPGSGGSARLQKIIGITRTKDIVMRSRRIG